MSISMHSASVPVFTRVLDAMLGWLDKAQAHAEARKFSPDNYLTLRFAPDMLPERAGELSIEPLTDGPLSLRGNVEITSGTGRVVARLTQAKLCRCGGSQNKPFCDGSHARIGFRSS